MATSQLLVVDNLSDRRDIWAALHKLSPRDRVRFVAFACGMVPRGAKGELPVANVWGMKTTLRDAYRCDRADERLTNECYADMLSLAAHWGLDLVKAAIELERWARDSRHRPRPREAAGPPPARRPPS